MTLCRLCPTSFNLSHACCSIPCCLKWGCHLRSDKDPLQHDLALQNLENTPTQRLEIRKSLWCLLQARSFPFFWSECFRAQVKDCSSQRRPCLCKAADRQDTPDCVLHTPTIAGSFTAHDALHDPSFTSTPTGVCCICSTEPFGHTLTITVPKLQCLLRLFRDSNETAKLPSNSATVQMKRNRLSRCSSCFVVHANQNRTTGDNNTCITVVLRTES